MSQLDILNYSVLTPSPVERLETMSSRTVVTGWLTQNVGFPFNESELSPSVRAKIGQLTELRQQVEIKHNSISQRQAEVARLKAQKPSNLTWIIILLILGALLVIVIVGAFLLLGGFLLYRRRKKIDTQIQQRVAEMVMTDKIRAHVRRGKAPPAKHDIRPLGLASQKAGSEPGFCPSET